MIIWNENNVLYLFIFREKFSFSYSVKQFLFHMDITKISNKKHKLIHCCLLFSERSPLSLIFSMYIAQKIKIIHNHFYCVWRKTFAYFPFSVYIACRGGKNCCEFVALFFLHFSFAIIYNPYNLFIFILSFFFKFTYAFREYQWYVKIQF